MRNLITTSVCILAALVLSLLLYGSATLSRGSVVATPLTLKERARQAGGRLVVTDLSHHGVVYHELTSLVNDSTAVIIGTVTGNRCRQTADEQNIATDYEVFVREVLKGDAKPGKVITVSTAGGLKVFDRSTSALIDVPDFRRPVNGKTYAFFLSTADGGVFPLAGGFQGAFELPPDAGNVRPSDLRPNSALTKRYKGVPVRAFTDELRAVVSK